ncbi:kelch-like protein 12 isoform X2 [Heteronotia binoei]|uniref:kelch-like protein 12 isoform X2 n=1 Tax=Heteronotia binoei TaxID=13085 RepID=UPI00292D3BD4|nr:kelch-like protein 12 isoform X2 [Heteronotia binoei]
MSGLETALPGSAALRCHLGGGRKELSLSPTFDLRILLVKYRMLLASVSPYFRDIFIHSNGLQIKEFQLKDMASSTLHTLLNYLYTEELSLTLETAQDLFTAAGKLQILPLKEITGRFLEKNVTMKNSLNLYRLAHEHGHHALLQAALAYISQHFGALGKKDDFLSLEYHSLVGLISSDRLEVASELTVYQAIRSWAEYMPSVRLPVFKELLGHVRFPLLIPEEIMEVQADVSEYYRHMRLRWKELNGTGRLLESGGLRKGMYDDCFVCVEVHENWTENGDSLHSYLHCFDPHAEKWEKLPPLRYLSYSGCASLDFKLYLSGGQTGECTFVDSLYEYNSLTGQWTQLSSMSTARAVHPFLACDKNLYALGGCSDTGPLTSAETYSVNQSTWAPISNLPLALMYPASAVLNNKLYLIGGKANRNYRGLLIYDTRTDWWNEVLMEFACYGAAAVSVGSGMYVIGGYTEERGSFLAHSAVASEEIPSSTKGSFYLHEDGRVDWEVTIPELPVALTFACAVEQGRKIYLLAGKDDNRLYNTCYSWVPQDTSWIQCPEEIPTTDEGRIFSCAILKMPKKPIQFLLLEMSTALAIVGVEETKKGQSSFSAREGCSLNCCWGGR